MSEYQADYSNKCFCRLDVTEYSTHPAGDKSWFYNISDKNKVMSIAFTLRAFRHFKVGYVKV